MPYNYVVRKAGEYQGEWYNRGETLDLTGYSSRQVATLMRRGIVDVVPTSSGGTRVEVVTESEYPAEPEEGVLYVVMPDEA
jgi:hypothetical protein